MTEKVARACIFCRNNDMADECWHSPEYEPVARALATAFQQTYQPTDEQVGWYVDDAEEIGSDLWHYLGRETPLTCRDLGSMDREPDLHAVLFNDRIVVTMQSTDTGESMAHVVADLSIPSEPAVECPDGSGFHDYGYADSCRVCGADRSSSSTPEGSL